MQVRRRPYSVVLFDSAEKELSHWCPVMGCFTMLLLYFFCQLQVRRRLYSMVLFDEVEKDSSHCCSWHSCIVCVWHGCAAMLVCDILLLPFVVLPNAGSAPPVQRGAV
jgi:hypothetical protein